MSNSSLKNYLGNQKEPRIMRGSSALRAGSRHGAGDVAEGITDAGAKQAHHTDHNKCHKSNDDRILHKALTFFL